MSRLEVLLEQTEYLLKKQEEAKQFCSKAFAELLQLIKEKINAGQAAGQDIKNLERVYDVISGQAQRLADETEDDINFLQEQVEALRGIARMEDPAKAKEALNYLIDPSEELMETEEFIAGINEEMAMSAESLQFTLSDIKDALLEGDVATVEAMLLAMATNDDLDINLSEEDEDEEDGCCGSGGCSTGGCGSCPSACGSEDGVDIFSQFNKYDQDLAKDSKSSCGDANDCDDHKH